MTERINEDVSKETTSKQNRNFDWIRPGLKKKISKVLIFEKKKKHRLNYFSSYMFLQADYSFIIHKRA